MLEPLPNSEWNRAKAAHLLKRAGFGGTPEEISTFSKLTPEEAVNRLVDWEPVPDPYTEPEWASPGYGSPIKDRQELRKLGEEERRALFKEFQQSQRQNIQDLRERWLQRMLATPRPLQEKLTLFWHGHFATSAEKVKIGYFMWKQLDLFRRLGNGSYETLLIEVGRDPAMLVWLDGAQSNRNAPNENYARELMELFTLGEGHYSEDDIKESARAFTGWTVDRFTQMAKYVPQKFDGSRKKFLGESGNFRDEDIVRVILKQEQSAKYLTAKLWTFFAYENPEPALVESLASTFRSEKMEMKPLLKRMFLSREFYSAKALQTQIKSPVQWWIGMQKSLEMSRSLPRMITYILNQLGQNLLQPPNVKGWDGGRSWISTTTLMVRHNVAHLLVYGGTADTLGMGENKKVGKPQEPEKKESDPASPGMMTEEKPDPAMQKREERQQRMLSRKIPPLISPSKLAPPELRKNRDQLVASLTERCLLSPAPSSTLLSLQKSLSDSDQVLNDEQIKALLYQIMIRPEFQLT